MLDAPSDVTDHQLREIHVKINVPEAKKKENNAKPVKGKKK